MNDPSAAAYGGPGWSPRTDRLRDEIGSVWGNFSVESECSPLKAVLLLAAACRAEGVEVHFVQPDRVPTPNQMFVADLMFMTPSGAILGRPASTVRAGEERRVARRLADLGIPILRSIGGSGTFEGADAAWLDSNTVLIGRGFRTNSEETAQVSATLEELGVQSVVADLPHHAMHLMGAVRLVDRDLA